MKNGTENSRRCQALSSSIWVLFLTLLWPLALPCPAEIDSAQNRLVFEARLQQLLHETYSANPSLKAAGEKATAALATAAAARSLDPPLVGVDFYQIPINSFPDPVRNYDEIDYFMQQTIPFPGKLSSMSNVGRKQAEMLRADSATAAWDIRRQVQDAWYELYLVDRRKDLLKENHDLLESFSEIARKQYEVGTGKQSDILRSQTELSRVTTDSIALEQTRISALAAINSLRSKPVDSAIPTVPEIPPPFTGLTMEKLKSVAESNRPEIASMKSAIAMQQAGLIAARKQYYPDFMLRGSYKQMRVFPDDWEFMVGVTVPIAPWSLGRFSGGYKNADALSTQAQYDYSNMRNIVLAQVRDALAKVQSNQARIEIIRNSIIPQARQTLQSTIAAYQTGKQDFLTLIDTRRMLLDAELDYHMAIMQLLQSRAQLERAVGVSVEEMERSEK